MTKTTRIIFKIVYASSFFFLAAAFTRPEASPKDLFRAGVAVVDFDLPEGVPVAGYGGGDRRNYNPFSHSSPYAHFFKPAKGVLDPVRAKALIFEKGDTKILWIGVDMVAASPDFVSDVATRVAGLGIQKNHILVSASHTHSGPGAFTGNKFWALVAVDRFHNEIYNHMMDKIMEAVTKANRGLTEARLGISELTILDVTHNRRHSPQLDPVATIIRIDDAAGKPMATAFTFPIHGTAQGPSNLFLSADVSGAIERSIEKQTNVPALFFNGAEGDVAPLMGSEPEAWDRAQALGAKIAKPIVQARQEIATTIPSRLAMTDFELSLPPAKFSLAACVKKRGLALPLGKYLPHVAPFRGLVIDQAAFVTIPGEAITELGLRIKAYGHQLGFKQVGVVGLTNEHLGYILTPEEYALGGMEACASMYGPQLGDQVVEAAKKILTQLSI